MPSTAERLGIVETKVENLSEKLDDLKADVKEMHDCLDKTRDDLTGKLEEMYQASCTQHAELAKKISSLEKLKEKWTFMILGGVFVITVFGAHFDKILKLMS